MSLLDSPVRRRIVDLLADRSLEIGSLDDGDGGMSAGMSAGMTAGELGDALRLHTTTARFHLDQLEAAGLVESLFQRRGVGRPRKVYRTPHRSMSARGSPVEALTELSALLAEPWDQPAHAQPVTDAQPVTPEEAGRRWSLRHAAGQADAADSAPVQARTPGAWIGKVGAALDLLHRWGYLPELRTENGGRTAELTLLDCPFLELAQEHPDIVCAVHRGLLRGALEAVGEHATEVGLQPLVAPRRCRATVTTRAAFDATPLH